APISLVAPLGPVTDEKDFTVSWSGQDDGDGSGLAGYAIDVSIDGGPWKPWLIDTTDTSATYHGAPGHSYAFRSRAVDHVGNREPAHSAPATRTTVAAGSPGVIVDAPTLLTTTEAGGTATFTVVLNAPPTAAVTIPILSGDLTEGTVALASLTFTTSNW